MSKKPPSFDWPKCEYVYDERGRLISENHTYKGKVIARVTFDPENGHKTSYSSGDVTLFYNEKEILLRKEIRNEDGVLTTVEHYSPQNGKINSPNDVPARTRKAKEGNIVYLAWYKDGKKHRPRNYNAALDKLEALPAVVRFHKDGIEENAYYEEDELNDPSPGLAAIRCLKDGLEIAKCHFRNNAIHNENGPAIKAIHADQSLVADALNGKFVSAEFNEPRHKVSFKFDGNGNPVGRNENTDLSDLDVPKEVLDTMNENLADDVADSILSMIPDFSDPTYRKKANVKEKTEGGEHA